MSSIKRWFNRHYRQEATQRVWDATTYRASPPTFVPQIIQGEVWERDSIENQRAVAEQDPIAGYLIRGLSENCFDDWFDFVDADGNVIMRDVQAELKRLNAQFYLTQALIAERTFGWSWLYTGREQLREDVLSDQTPRIANLDYFTPEDTEVMEFDELGYPSSLIVKITSMTGDRRMTLPIEDFILIRTRPYYRGYMGRPALYNAWDLLVYIRLIQHALSWYASKVGLGIFVIKVKGSVNDDTKDVIQAMTEDFSVKRGVVLDTDMYESLSFEGAQAGSVDFVAMIDSLMGLVASSVGVPKDLLTGVSAGSVTGSETNLKSLYATLNSIQTSMEPTIRELVRRMGHDNDYLIRWNVRFNPNPVETAQVEQARATALATKSKFLTVNEIRAELGYPPIADGDRLSDDVKINVAGLQSQQEQQMTNNPGGINV